jgi:hypothetical protein
MRSLEESRRMRTVPVGLSDKAIQRNELSIIFINM